MTEKYCIYCKKEKIKKGAEKYCSYKCHKEHQYETYIIRWKNGLESGLKGEYQISDYIRRYLLEKYDHKCSSCGWNEINPYSNTIPLEVEHIDGNYENNKEENLTLLCPNCHSLTKTYKSLNRGNGRETRRKNPLN